MFPIQYIAQNTRDEAWGLTVCSVGYQDIKKNSPYPPLDKPHNKEYLFNPKTGRVINEYQLIYIVEGSGKLKTASCEEKHIEKGNIFLIFPGEWHTYCPNPETGWKEYWIGFKGMNMSQRVDANFFSVENPIYNIGYSEVIISLYRESIEIAKRQEKHFQQLLCGIVNYMLGLVFSIHENKKETNISNLELVDDARNFMIDNLDRNMEMPEVARHLNISYSSFRHIFKQYTGIAPTQYYLNLKIQKAKEMLRSTSMSIKEISYILNFETPEYFTRLFKKKTGMSPTTFRDQ